MKLRAILVALGLLAGFSLGLVRSQTAQGAISVTAYVNPGASGAGFVGYVNCFWHVSACPLGNQSPNNGNAMDWQNSYADAVWWRSYGYRSDTSGTLGTFTLTSLSPGCHIIRAAVADVFGFEKGFIDYYHSGLSAQSGVPFGINASPSLANTSMQIGTTIWDGSNCGWTGYHLHQQGSSYWARNFGAYPRYGDWGNGVGPYSIGLQSQYLHAQSWCWFC